MKKTTSDRLKEIMKQRNLKQIDILNDSKKYQEIYGINMSKSALSQYVNGVQSPDQDRIFLLAKTLDVGEAWLLGYGVDSFRDPVNTSEVVSHKSDVIAAHIDDDVTNAEFEEILNFIDYIILKEK